MTAPWIIAARAAQLTAQREVTFLPYADDPRVLLHKPGCGRMASYSLADIARRLGADMAYRYRTAAQVARQRGLTGQLLVYLEPGIMGEGDRYMVQDTAQSTEVSLGKPPSTESTTHQVRLL